MESLTLHGYWRSSSTWRVRIALHHKGLSWETVPVHLIEDGGQQNKPGFLARNPMGQVPVLEVDGIKLSQSMAIIEYLEERWPNPPLLPGSPEGRARVRQLAEIVNAGIQPLQNLSVLKLVSNEGRARRKWAAQWIHKGFEALEKIVSQTSGCYCVGDEVTVADCCLIPQMYNARMYKMSLSPYPTLRRIEGACFELEAFGLTHPNRQPDAENGTNGRS